MIDRIRIARSGFFLTAILLSIAAVARAQSTVATGQWPCFGGNPGCQRYTPLDQITADNFGEL